MATPNTQESAPTVIDWNEKSSRTLADKAITFGDVVLRLTRESLSTSRMHALMYSLVELDLEWQLVRMSDLCHEGWLHSKTL